MIKLTKIFCKFKKRKVIYMEQIAIISDIHGNLEALKAVLEDIKERKVGNIMCIGDIIAKGSHSKECVELIKKNCNVVIKGNCDEYFTSDDIAWSEKPKIEYDRMVWNREKLSDDNIRYLQSLPYCHEFYMSGRLVRLIHANPEKIDQFIGNIDTIDRLYSLFLPSKHTISQEKADVLIYGHIHTPFVQRIYNRTIINTGAVGMAMDVFRNEEKDGDVKNTTVANYLILRGNMNSKNIEDKISYELVNVPYDIEKELSNSIDHIELEDYEHDLRNGLYGNMEKIYKSFELREIKREDV